MLLSRDRLMNLPLMSLQTGTQVGTATQPIVDPRRLNIVAFYCEGPLIDFSPAVLHVDDIREFSSIGLIIDGADNIMPPDDLVRLQEVIAFHFALENKPVVEEDGHKLGKVGGYTVDSDSFYIVKLQVKPTFMQSIARTELLVDRTQIREINDKHIVVRRASVEDEARSRMTSMPAIDNPFRKAQHIPEAQPSTTKNKTESPEHPTSGA